MREILFRGKRKDNGEWIEGAFCEKNCDSFFGPMVDMPSIIKLDYPHSGYWFEVIGDTVGQYTGLTDKKIFEGDDAIISHRCLLREREICGRWFKLQFQGYLPPKHGSYRKYPR